MLNYFPHLSFPSASILIPPFLLPADAEQHLADRAEYAKMYKTEGDFALSAYVMDHYAAGKKSPTAGKHITIGKLAIR